MDGEIDGSEGKEHLKGWGFCGGATCEELHRCDDVLFNPIQSLPLTVLEGQHSKPMTLSQVISLNYIFYRRPFPYLGPSVYPLLIWL